MKTLRGIGGWIGAAALLLTACNRNAPPDTSAPAVPDAAESSTDAAGSDGAAASAAPATTEAQVGSVQSLRSLVSDSPSPIVRNNAKAALDAWNQQDYGSAVVFLKTVMSLPEAQLQAAAVGEVVQAMQAELQRASRGGNRAAKQALEDLALQQ